MHRIPQTILFPSPPPLSLSLSLSISLQTKGCFTCGSSDYETGPGFQIVDFFFFHPRTTFYTISVHTLTAEDNSRKKMREKNEIPLTQSAPAIPHDITRHCWLCITVQECQFHADAFLAPFWIFKTLFLLFFMLSACSSIFDKQYKQKSCRTDRKPNCIRLICCSMILLILTKKYEERMI